MAWASESTCSQRQRCICICQWRFKEDCRCRIQPYRIQSQIDTSEKGYSATETGIGEINSEGERDLSEPKPSIEKIEGPKTR